MNSDFSRREDGVSRERTTVWKDFPSESQDPL